MLSGFSGSNVINANESITDNILEESQLYEVTADSSGDYDFNWTYYLYVPEGVKLDEVNRIVVEPASGLLRTNKYSQTKKNSKETAQTRVLGRRPKLVPAFPVYEDLPTEYSDGWDGVSVGLSRSTMKLDGDLERIDLQLLEMVGHARDKLNDELGMETYDDIFLWGHSITGTFVTNFAKIHPGRVRAYVAGGIDTMILPKDSLAGYALNYSNGINDLSDLTGSNFNRSEYADIAKYFFIGELESFYSIDLDTTLGSALWETMDKSYVNSFDRIEEIYQEENIPAQFVTYKTTTHQIREEILQDTIRFFDENMGQDNKEINPHEYAGEDYKFSFDKIDEAKILDVYWGQDPNLPEELAWIYEYDGGEEDNMVFATDASFDSEIQLIDFIKKADFRFTMKADGYKEVKLTPWDIEPTFYRAIDTLGKEYNGILLRLIPDNMADIDQSVEYTIEMDDSIRDYYGIEDNIRIEPIE